MMVRVIFSLLISVTLIACQSAPLTPIIKQQANPLLATIHTEEVVREFRAAWVATVANINWPQQPGLPVEEQKRQAIKILDTLQTNNFNTVIFQVRPQADALYQSSTEPWSYYLTGEQGKATEPFYDPLQFWIEQAHQRGLKLHAWFNPYRVHHPSGGIVSEQSISMQMAEDVVQLKNGMHWFIPTNQSVIDYSIATLLELVENYDIDGLHYDDYFYPYPSYNEGEDFPDQSQYLDYQKQGGKLSKGNWRRAAVNQFTKTLYEQVKQLKPHVQVGISPFGIYRPKQPATIRGLDQYEKLYADAKLWLNEGWLDYFTPQLYWPINQYSQSYPLLIAWWQSQNTQNRHLWPGINTLIANTDAGIDEIVNQIMINRAMLNNSPGVVFWNVKSLENADFSQVIEKGVFQHQALLPLSNWLPVQEVSKPAVSYNQYAQVTKLSWHHAQPEHVFKTLVYLKYGDDWQYKIYPSIMRSITVENNNNGLALSHIRVVAVSRDEMLSEPIEIQFE
ncbi:glycoside hydrolase family 10 protein [Pseudoalteromonas sp. SR41-8]|uniref:glycoside hydrolase family 10 protein n=1 Tax=Pseudoalteromonas sp. SR41-8 TaxID=2760946 RepID=UPI002175FE9D|nr:family 10 glycosylhydrolase [Pseudoalteromonas sp. SR41-8]